MGLFEPGADWAVAASHVEVFKLYGEWVVETATSPSWVAWFEIEVRAAG